MFSIHLFSKFRIRDSEFPMAYQEHITSAKEIIARCAIITLSDTRDESSDTSGGLIRKLLGDAGHSTAFYRVIKDDPAALRTLLTTLLTDNAIDAILTNGGTGIATRDQTIDVVQSMITTPLPGFGELFRMLSWEQIGAGAMLSRAVGGIACGELPESANRKPLFAMPGSSKAVDLAMTRLIIPELRHILWELRKSPT
jgi:molybdenum cofactor biosynthesis protein B